MLCKLIFFQGFDDEVLGIYVKILNSFSLEITKHVIKIINENYKNHQWKLQSKSNRNLTWFDMTMALNKSEE